MVTRLKLWLLEKNAHALEDKIYNGTATKKDHELLDRFGDYYDLMLRRG